MERRGRMNRGSKAGDVTEVLLGLGLAALAIGLTFGGPRRRFWQRMTWTGLTLGGLSLASDPELRRPRCGRRDVLHGLRSAAGLYLLFQVGDRLARRLLPGGSRDIESLYALQQLRPKAELAARLVLVIAPAEELFWRGFLRRRLERRCGPWRGTLLAAAAYGGAHLSARNLALLGAASVAGLYWGVLARLGLSMPALIVSHVVWDLWIFLIAPTRQPPPRDPDGSDESEARA
jgi:membrane protease YdiL (CAAX protease family)